MKLAALALTLACATTFLNVTRIAHAVEVLPPGTIATFSNAGAFNSTFSLTIDRSYDLVATSVGVCITTPCRPDVVQVYTRSGYRVADIALKPSDAWGGVTLILPAGAYLVHVTGAGALTRLTVSTK